MRDEGDRFVAWRLDDAPATPSDDLENERMERALLAYAHRSAARVGAEWFAAEFARREEQERQREVDALSLRTPAHEAVLDVAPEMALIDASVEDAVLGGAPTGLGLGPAPEPKPEALAPELEPAALEPTALEPVTLEPAALEPAAVEPVALEPVTREPAAEPPMIEPDPPAIRHPHVPRPPAPEPRPEPKRRGRRRRQVEAPAPSFVISPPEWARMSPGARRLYGVDAAPPAAAAG